MLTLEQARNNIDQVLMNVREPALTRPEHDLLRQSLNLLYETAKDGEETTQSLHEARENALRIAEEARKQLIEDTEDLGTDTNTTE